ncbi:TetR family transcriptional regulator [Metabacillus niabensis]|uniref:TetR family transcriptional regulator n=1 Tax=Metabacillus niabensis TaxID=324854 RepID=UPI0039A3363A
MDKKSGILSRKDILDAAEKTLRRYGQKKTSVTDVAKELNMSHGSIYRHFPNKSALKEAVTERWLEEEIMIPLRKLLKSEETSPNHLLKDFFLKLISLKQNHAKNDEEMFEMYAEVTGEATELITNHVNCIIEMLNQIIEKGINLNVFKPVADKEVISRSIFYATARFHHPSHAYEWKNSKRIREEFEQVWDLIQDGFTISN